MRRILRIFVCFQSGVAIKATLSEPCRRVAGRIATSTTAVVMRTWMHRRTIALLTWKAVFVCIPTACRSSIWRIQRNQNLYPTGGFPGKRDRSFAGYAAFNAGFQFMDFSDPANPKADGYFVPPSGGDISKRGSYTRIGDGMFVEWDRNLIWAMADSGVFLLSHPSLGEPDFSARAVQKWTLDGLNQGAPG